MLSHLVIIVWVCVCGGVAETNFDYLMDTRSVGSVGSDSSGSSPMIKRHDEVAVDAPVSQPPEEEGLLTSYLLG